ncbi:uncharacterized protein TRIVIDRAFT_122917, partial [Trichoderma virens Gv29-8]
RRQDLLNKFTSKFRSALNQVERTPTRNELREEFSAEIEECMTDQGGSGRFNILHWIARLMELVHIGDGTANWPAAECLAEIATRMKPEMLLAEDDKSKLTPIHMFIECAQVAPRSAGRVILAMCRAAGGSQGKANPFVSDAISKVNKEGENVLHLAIQKDLEICSQLIGMANPDAVTASCKTYQNTPLHLAVTRLCLCTDTKRQEDSGLCDNYELLEEKTRRFLDDMAALIAKNPKALMAKDSEGRSPYLHYVHLRDTTVKATTSGPPDTSCTKKSFEEDLVETHLVESAFILGTFDKVCDCFFGGSIEERNLNSVFRPERPLARFDESTYTFFQFGSTVAHVDLSIDPENASGELSSVIVEEARGVLLKTFQMLYNKGVRRILKLTVQDIPNAPCDDEFIVSCLRQFDIRYLDWNKPDLCIDIIIDAVPRVSDLCLYFTGNTAVIRGWAGSNGLVNLNQLRAVHIQSCAGPEAVRRQAYMDKFQMGLCENIQTNRKFEIMKMAWQRNLYGRDQLRIHQSPSKQPTSPEAGDGPVRKEAKPAEDETSTLTIEDENAKLKVRIATFLLQKETYERRTTRRLRDDDDLKGKNGQLAESIDITELQYWGIRELRDCSCMFDFLAVNFRVKKHLIEREPDDEKKAEPREMPFVNRKSDTDEHVWMNTLRDFVSRNLHGNMPERRVKVALIDDGVDVNTPCLRGKIKCGWPNEPPTSVSVPWYQSFGGHGTAMAHLITAACPNVEFYVVQLKTFNIGDQHSDSACKNAAEEATEAIKWARENNVHIISMSWKIRETDENRDEMLGLKSELERAAADGILMYCAAPGQHKPNEVFCPSSGRSCVKVVGSVDKDGKMSKGVSAEEVDYFFPGENLQEIGLRKGNSAATALAAGFAALIIWSYESQSANSQKLTPSDMDHIFKTLHPGGKECKMKPKDSPSNWVNIMKILGHGKGVVELARWVSLELER